MFGSEKMNTAIDRSAPQAKTTHPWLIAIVVSMATFMEVLDTTIVNVALAHIAGTLGVSQHESTWVLTSYLVSNAIILPISGWLANVIGRKRYFLICVVWFTMTSFACGAATTLGMLVVFRLLQGLAGGGLQPTQQAIILHVFPKELQGTAFSITGITIVAAPIIGPTLGGWITDHLNWRWIFFINVPVGMLSFFLAKQLVPESENDQRTAKGFSIDYIGLGLVALSLGVLQIILDKGEIEDWFDSNFIVTLSLICATAFALCIVWLLKQQDPVINLELLGKPSFGLSCLLMFLTGFAIYGSSALIPFLVQTEFGYDATLAGLVISPGGMAVICLMPISGKLVSRVHAKYLIIIGFTLNTVGMLYTSFMTPDTDYETFVVMRIGQVIGIPFLFIPIATLAFSEIPKPLYNKASALFALSRNLGGSVGVAITTTYVSRHQQVYQSFLSTHSSPSDSVFQSYLSKWTNIIADHGFTQLQAGNTALLKIYGELLHQAAILAYSSVFLLLASAMLLGVIIAIFLPHNELHHKKANNIEVH